MIRTGKLPLPKLTIASDLPIWRKHMSHQERDPSDLGETHSTDDTPEISVIDAGYDFPRDVISILMETIRSPFSTSVLTFPSIRYLTYYGAQSPPRTNERRKVAKKEVQLPNQAVLKPAFKLVFLTVSAATLFSALVQLGIAHSWPQPTPVQQATFESFAFAWKAGFGAILGLLGGKLA
jgi:hypothetical protein